MANFKNWKEIEILEGYIYDFWKLLPLPLCYVNSLHFVLDINESLEKVFGYTQVEMAGENIEKFFAEQSVIEDFKKEILKKGVYSREAVFLNKNKEKIPVNLRAITRKDKEGYFIGYFLVVEKIQASDEFFSSAELKEQIKNKTTELEERVKDLKDSRIALLNMLEDAEEAKKAVEEEREITLSIVANFVDGLINFDMNNRLILTNTKAEEIFSVSNKELAGKSIDELNKIPSLKPLIDLLGDSGKSKNIKDIFRKELKIKEYLIIEVSTIPVVKKEKQSGVLVILHDVTREKMVEKLKTEFVSISAHQLRTPLSAIKWTIKMLTEGDLGELTKEQNEFLEKIYISNERMIALINDLLDVTRIEEGRYLYNLSPVSIEELAQNVAESYKEEFKKKEINFSFCKLTKMPKLNLDAEKIKVGMQNLFDNALRYTGNKGRIEACLEYDKKKNKISFSIKDTGIGIAEEQKERIFTRFFRGANALKMETEGSGLGLYIARNIVEAHHGNIWFESKEGEGSTFGFNLPVMK